MNDVLVYRLGVLRNKWIEFTVCAGRVLDNSSYISRCYYVLDGNDPETDIRAIFAIGRINMEVVVSADTELASVNGSYWQVYVSTLM